MQLAVVDGELLGTEDSRNFPRIFRPNPAVSCRSYAYMACAVATH